MNHLRRPIATGAIAMALRVELGGDSRYGQSLALPGLSTKLLHALDQVLLGRKMTVRLHPFDAFTSGALAFIVALCISGRVEAVPTLEVTVPEPSALALSFGAVSAFVLSWVRRVFRYRTHRSLKNIDVRRLGDS